MTSWNVTIDSVYSNIALVMLVVGGAVAALIEQLVKNPLLQQGVLRNSHSE